MEEEYKHTQGKKKILKEHRTMGKHDRVHKKAKKIAAVKAEFEKKGYETETIADGVMKRHTLVDKAKKRLAPDKSEPMEDAEGGLAVDSLKKKVGARREFMELERAQGTGLKKDVSRCLDV
jgi:hypothetical protein